jgi:hypothetical protein
MNLLKKLFKPKEKKDCNSAQTHIAKLTFLLDYREHYSSMFTEPLSNKELAELYLYRGWVTQFGYRIFSSDQKISESLIGETVNATKYFGLDVFQQVHNFSLEESLGGQYMQLLDSRWRRYDNQVVGNMSDGIPVNYIVSELLRNIGRTDPTTFFSLSHDLIDLLGQIKSQAIEIGLLKGDTSN